MTITTQRLGDTLRIIGAITEKDVADSLKNRTILAMMIGAFMIVLQMQALPLLLGLERVPTVYLLTNGAANLAEKLAGVDALDLREVDSRAELENIVAEASRVRLGLIIPPQAAESGVLTFEGIIPHRASAATAGELVEAVEAALSETLEQPVQINTSGNIVYPAADSRGHPSMITLALVILITIIGLYVVPYLILEEKETGTMDALLVSPASTAQVVAGKGLTGLAYCALTAAVVLGLNGRWIAHWSLALAAITCGALLMVAIGLLAGTFFDDQMNLNLVMSLLILLLMIVPAFTNIIAANTLPSVIRQATSWLPTVLLADLVRMSMAETVPPGQAALYLGALAVGSVGLLMLVNIRIRRLDR